MLTYGIIGINLWRSLWRTPDPSQSQFYSFVPSAPVPHSSLKSHRKPKNLPLHHMRASCASSRRGKFAAKFTSCDFDSVSRSLYKIEFKTPVRHPVRSSVVLTDRHCTYVMNFFRAKAKKRSRKEEDDDNDPCIDEVSSHSVIHDHAVASDLDANIQFILICLYLNPKSKRTMVNWIKDKFNKLLKRNSTESFLPQFGETPAHLKVGRYLLSPDVVSTTQATAPSR